MFIKAIVINYVPVMACQGHSVHRESNQEVQDNGVEEHEGACTPAHPRQQGEVKAHASLHTQCIIFYGQPKHSGTCTQ